MGRKNDDDDYADGQAALKRKKERERKARWRAVVKAELKDQRRKDVLAEAIKMQIANPTSQQLQVDGVPIMLAVMSTTLPTVVLPQQPAMWSPAPVAASSAYTSNHENHMSSSTQTQVELDEAALPSSTDAQPTENITQTNRMAENPSIGVVQIKHVAQLIKLGLQNRVRLFRNACSAHAMHQMLSLCEGNLFQPIRDIVRGPSDFFRSTHPLPKLEWSTMEHVSLTQFRKKVLRRRDDMVSAGSILRSVQGGFVQSWHLDFNPDAVMRASKVPYTVLLCMHDYGKLYIRGDNNEVLLLHMSAGDACTFDGDVWHAGGAYDDIHLRAHWFVQAQDRRASHVRTQVVPHLYYHANGSDADEHFSQVGAITHEWNRQL